VPGKKRRWVPGVGSEKTALEGWGWWREKKKRNHSKKKNGGGSKMHLLNKHHSQGLGGLGDPHPGFKVM